METDFGRCDIFPISLSIKKKQISERTTQSSVISRHISAISLPCRSAARAVVRAAHARREQRVVGARARQSGAEQSAVQDDRLRRAGGAAGGSALCRGEQGEREVEIWGGRRQRNRGNVSMLVRLAVRRAKPDHLQSEKT